MAVRRSKGSASADFRSLVAHHPRSFALAVGVGLAISTVALLEAAFFLVDRVQGRPAVVETDDGEMFVDDDVLGYALLPGSRVRSTKSVDGENVYDVVYTADGYGRRVTPSSGPTSADDVIVLFGCSNTFGEGVEDDQTLAHYLGLSFPDRAVINAAFRGYGPQQMLALLEDGRLDRFVEGKSVTAIYLFIDYHVERAVGSMVVTTTWGANMPAYVLDEEGRPVRLGSFRSTRPLTNWFYALVSKSNVLGHYNVDLPILTAGHYELTARIIEESAKRLAQKARRSQFLFVLHPTATRGPSLVPHLDRSVVEVLDYEGLWGRADTEFVIAGDWHPTPRAHETLAARIADSMAAGEHVR